MEITMATSILTAEVQTWTARPRTSAIGLVEANTRRRSKRRTGHHLQTNIKETITWITLVRVDNGTKGIRRLLSIHSRVTTSIKARMAICRKECNSIWILVEVCLLRASMRAKMGACHRGCSNICNRTIWITTWTHQIIKWTNSLLLQLDHLTLDKANTSHNQDGVVTSNPPRTCHRTKTCHRSSKTCHHSKILKMVHPRKPRNRSWKEQIR